MATALNKARKKKQTAMEKRRRRSGAYGYITAAIIILMITLGAALGYVFELIKDLFSRGGKKNVY